MNRNRVRRGLWIALGAVAMLMFCACTVATPTETAVEEPTNRVETPEATPEENAVTVPESPEVEPAAEEEAPAALFENEYVRIYFTEFSADDGTITFRIENLTQGALSFLTPLDITEDMNDAKDFLLIDGVAHMAVPNSGNTIAAGGTTTYKITTATGPDAEGYLNLEPLSESAKTAEFTKAFSIGDENKNELAAITLPTIDLTAPVFFPLPSIKEFSTLTLSGEAIDSSYFSAHKLTMVNFWATWCGPCVSEMPDISALHEEFADQGFAVLGVLVWDEGSEKSAQDFLLSSGIAYPVVVCDTVPAFVEFASTQFAIPFTIFVDAEGNQVGELEVGSKSKEEWAATINGLLQQVG